GAGSWQDGGSANIRREGAMRKVLGVAALLCAAVLAGCSGGGEGAGGTGSDAITVGFSQVGAESEWRTANTRSVKEALAAPEFNLKFSDAQQKQENQIKALRSFIAPGGDVIAFSTVSEPGADPVLRAAKPATITVLRTARAVTVS